MSDSWIDKNELDELVSGFSHQQSGHAHHVPEPEDLFDDIPAIHMPRSQAQPVSPHVHPEARVEAPMQQVQSPLQMLVNPNRPATVEQTGPFSSPFDIDEDDEIEEIESQIEHLASETANALRTLQEIRAQADRNGLIAQTRVESEVEPEIEIVETELEPIEEKQEPLDRIPLDVEIDSHLSLKGRLRSLAEILEKYVDMEEMMVVDRDGFSLFSTKESLTVERSVGEFVRAIRKVYESEADARVHTASQLAIENDKWLCIIPTDGEIEGRFLLKALLPVPLDRPEIYVLVELLNEVLRPEGSQ